MLLSDEVLQCHGCHQLPCMEFMIGSCMITKMSCDAMMDCAVPSTWYEAKQSCQKNAKVRHPIEQVLILPSFADFCARFAEFCARFARAPFHIFSSFTNRSCKLATCSHPVQGHNGAAWGWYGMIQDVHTYHVSVSRIFQGHVGKQFQTSENLNCNGL